MRALARVDLAAIERNCARLARVAAPAALCAVVKADGYGHGARARRARRAGRRARPGSRSRRRPRRPRCAPPGSSGPLLVMGALSPAELTVALRGARRRRRVARGVRRPRSPRIPTARARGVHVKLDTGMGRLGTRDAAEATRAAAAVAAAPRLRLAGAMTHFATADDDPAFAREQLARFLPWARCAARGATATCCCTPPTRPPRSGSRSRASDMVRCGIAAYGMDPFGERPGAPRARRPRSSCAPTSPRSSRSRRGRASGYGRRFVAAAPTWIGTVPVGYADGVRRALTQRLRRARRRPPRAARRARSRWTTSPSTSGRSRRSAARRPS